MRKYFIASRRWLPRFRLAANWRKLHRSYTVLLSALLAGLSVAQEHWPAFQSFIPTRQFAVVSLVLALLITVLRYVEQPVMHHGSDGKGDHAQK